MGFRVGTSYCFPRAVEFGQTFDDGSQTLTKAKLDSACSPCMRRYIRVLIALSSDSLQNSRDVAAIFDMLCLETTPSSGEYCFLEFERINARKQENPPPSDVELLTEQCGTTCFARLGLVAKAYNVTGFGNDDFRATQLLCYKNPAGELCLVKTFEKLPSLPQTCPDTTCAAPCNGETGDGCPNPVAPYCAGDKGGRAQRAENYCNVTMCGAVMDEFIGSMGCCSNYIADIQPAEERPDFERWVTAAPPVGCGRTFNPRCAGQTMKIRMTVSNIRAAWVIANMARFRAAILKDLAANSGVDPARASNIQVDTSGASSRSLDLSSPSTWFSTRSAGSVVVTLDLEAPDSGAAGDASRNLIQGDFASPNTSGQGEDAVSDQNEGVSVSVDSTDCENCVSKTSSPAARVDVLSFTFSAVLAVSVAVLAFL